MEENLCWVWFMCWPERQDSVPKIMLLVLEFSFLAFKLVNELHFRFDDSSDFNKSVDLEASANSSASSDFCPRPLIAFAT